ncbi:uncharacterized protein LOC134230070 [Saccostrea cucullata]|uniref:uncharacterized protein LOC134230070 n=1 Tax=Saccostrea cuccullata TaxID=36930 RepID=UPI002ED1A421
MASICSNCPLAILSLSRVLKEISSCTLKETFLLYSNSTIHNDIMGIETCLQHSFSALNKSDKQKTMCTLMQLSVFRTLKFDIEAARFVCGRTSIGHANLEIEIGDLQQYHFLESKESLFQSEPIGKEHGQKVSSVKCYYIHPLVYQFLKSKEKQYQSIVNKAREKYVEFMHKTISKTSKMTSAESLTIIAKYEPHFQTFYEYVIHLHTTTRPTLIDLPSTLSVVNTEWLTDLVLDTTRRCQFFKSMISDAEEEGKVLELVYYKTCLAKLYFDNDRLERCHTILTEIDSIINKQKQLSKTANYLKHKKKIRDYPSALILGGFWTMQARYLNIFEKYGEAKQYLKWALSIMQKKERDCWSQIANIYNLMGVIAFKSKEYSTARDFHSKALTLVGKEHDGFIDKDIFLTNIGSAFFKEWDLNRQNKDALQEAEIYYSKALSMNTAIAEKRAKMLKMRGKLYLLQGKFEASEKDLQESLDIWKQYVHPPHINLISSYHGISFLFVSKAANLLKIGDPSKEAAGFLTRANVNYKEIKRQIEEGGFNNWQKNKVLYDEIKKSHTRVLKLLNKDEKEMEQMKMFYQDFEAGRYNKDSLPNQSLDLDDESSHMQSMFTYQNMESESDDSGSLSSDSEAYSLIETSDEEISVTQKCDDKTGRFNENTVSLPIAASCETKNDIGTRKPKSGIFSGSVDSGYGDSISSCSSSSESNSKPRLLSIPSGSMEEDVFSSSEKSALNHLNSPWKRKFCNRQNVCSLKRQKGFDDDFQCMGPNNVY